MGRIAAPGEVLFHEPADVLSPQRPVQGKEIFDPEPRRLLEDVLHLHAVLSDDVDVVSSRIVQKVVLEVHFIRPNAAAERPEGAEGVRREERTRRKIEAHHDLRPMHHGRKDELEGVPARRELVALLDEPLLPRAAAVIFEHSVYLLIADDHSFGMAQEHLGERRGMVGLHVMDDDVVERSAP